MGIMSPSAKTFNDVWEEYAKDIPETSPADQVFSMKLAFHHSAMTTLKIGAIRAIKAGPEGSDPEGYQKSLDYIWSSYIKSALPDDASLEQVSAVSHALQWGSLLAMQHLAKVWADQEESLEDKMRKAAIVVAEIEAFFAEASGEIQ